MYPRVKAASKASSEKLRLTLSKYYPESTSTTLITSLKEDEKVSVQLYAGNKLPMSILNWIFELFELNMKEMYESSEDGYDAKEKKQELFNSESRFIILRTAATTESKNPIPFAYGMFRFDTEQTLGNKYAQILYCYEVQIESTRRSLGAGKLIVDIMQQITKDWHLDKVMLTVFKSNVKAIQFYERNGFQIDEISPSKSEEDTDYEIYSKVVL